MNIHRLAGVAAAALLLAFAGPAAAEDAILAVTGKTDGNYMEVADRGPLFIVFAYDDVEEVRSALFYSRSVWQIHNIEIE